MQTTVVIRRFHSSALLVEHLTDDSSDLFSSPWLLQRLIYIVRDDEKIRALCSQLLRAEDPVVLDTVSAELHHAIEEYVRNAKYARSGCDIILEPLPSSAF